MTPSIRWTPPSQNGRQGGALGHFFSTDRGGTNPNSWPLDGCDITAASAQTIVPPPTTAFLNAALGEFAGVRTMGICNKPAG